jgi:hypothetical protein
MTRDTGPKPTRGNATKARSFGAAAAAQIWGRKRALEMFEEQNNRAAECYGSATTPPEGETDGG